MAVGATKTSLCIIEDEEEVSAVMLPHRPLVEIGVRVGGGDDDALSALISIDAAKRLGEFLVQLALDHELISSQEESLTNKGD